MTCVLPLSSSYRNPRSSFRDEKEDISEMGDELRINWGHNTNKSDCAILSDSGVARPLTPCVQGEPLPPGQCSMGEARSSVPCVMELGGDCIHTPLGMGTCNNDAVLDNPTTLFTGSYHSRTIAAEMCNKNNSDVDTSIRKGKKRKSDFEEFDEIFVPPKRISPFLNTPKEKKEERKKVLKISIQKLKHLEDPEIFLRRSVLINNTMKRLQTEVREEKMKQPKYGRRNKGYGGYSYGVLNNNCLSSSYMYDDPFLCNANEKITDDMTDTLMSNLRDKLGDMPNSETDPETEIVVDVESGNENNQSEEGSYSQNQSKCNSSNCSPSALCAQCIQNNNNIITSGFTGTGTDKVQNENENIASIDLGETSSNREFNFIVRGKLTDASSTCDFSNDVRTAYLTASDSHVVPQPFINQSVLTCSTRLDINMVIEQEVTSHSDIKSSADYSRSPAHFHDGIYAY